MTLNILKALQLEYNRPVQAIITYHIDGVSTNGDIFDGIVADYSQIVWDKLHDLIDNHASGGLVLRVFREDTLNDLPMKDIYSFFVGDGVVTQLDPTTSKSMFNDPHESENYKVNTLKLYVLTNT
jgi:hypothetical protein